MANARKFAALAGVRQPVVEETPEAESSSIIDQNRRPGRPAVGKRSKREYERTTVLLKSETKMQANRKIEDANLAHRLAGGVKNAGSEIKDLSELIQHLLEEYVSRHA